MKSQGKRLSIVSLPEVQELYSVPQFSPHEREYFFSLTDDELEVVNRLDLYRNRIHLILMLGYFKVKPVCLIYGWKNIEDDYRYVSEQYYPVASKQNKNLDRQTRSRLYSTVFDIVDYQRCDKTIESEMLTHLARRAKLYVDETQLFRDAIALLESKRVAIPRYSTLQKIILSAINIEETRLAELITKHLSDKGQFLCLIDSQEKQCRLQDLKKLTKAYKYGEIRKELARHQALSELSQGTLKLMAKLKLSEGNIRYFATRCQQYDINELRELKKEKALIYLTCFVATRFRISNDSLMQSFLVAFKEFDDQSIQYRDERVKQQALALVNEIDKVPYILDLFIDTNIKDKIDFGVVRHQAFKIIPKEQFPLVSQQMTNVKPDKAVFLWEFVDNNFNQVVRNMRPLLMALDLGCRDNTVLQCQFKAVKSALASNRGSPRIDGRLVKRGDKIYLKESAQGNPNHQKVIANRNEMYLYRLLYKGIQNGDIYVKNSLEYCSFDDYLVNDVIWNQRKKHLVEAGLGWMSEPSERYFSSLENTLNEKVTAVGQRITEGKNTYIKRKPNSDKLLWPRAVTPKNNTLTERFFAHFDRKTIVAVIRKVDAETNFFEHFKPKSNRYKKSTASVENLLACVIANGTFQGTH